MLWIFSTIAPNWLRRLGTSAFAHSTSTSTSTKHKARRGRSHYVVSLHLRLNSLDFNPFPLSQQLNQGDRIPARPWPPSRLRCRAGRPMSPRHAQMPGRPSKGIVSGTCKLCGRGSAHSRPTIPLAHVFVRLIPSSIPGSSNFRPVSSWCIEWLVRSMRQSLYSRNLPWKLDTARWPRSSSRSQFSTSMPGRRMASAPVLESRIWAERIGRRRALQRHIASRGVVSSADPNWE
jgi:hypothetical protein